MGVGTGVIGEPRQGRVSGGGVIGRYNLNTLFSGQLLPLPALFLPHREIFCLLHTQCSLSCIRPFTHVCPCHLECLFQNSTHPSRTSAEVTSFQEACQP